MGLIEVILIVVGAVALVVSYIVPAGRAGGNAVQAPKMDEKMVRDMVEKEIGGAKNRIGDMVEETLNYSMEKTERAMERLTNEKIMAINEYSEQVLGAINKNHQEVMFLYDMLNDKHTNLVNTVSEASQKAKEIRQTVQDAEITVKEAVGKIAGDTESMTEDGQSVERTAEEGSPAEDCKPDRPENGAAEEKRADKAATKKAQSPESAEFIPIAPRRVELVQGMIKEETVPVAGKGKEPVSETEDGKNHNNNDKILRLHKLGKSKTAIAKELGLGVGEVKLVIDLFEQ